MKNLIIIILFLISSQSNYCNEKYGITYIAKLNNGLSLFIDIYNNSKYRISAVRSSEGVSIDFQGEFSLGRYIKKKDSIIFIDELTNYRFLGVFVPGYPLGNRNIEIFINNKGDFFAAIREYECYKTDYTIYKNKLKEVKLRQKEYDNSFLELEKGSGKEHFKINYEEFVFRHFSMYDIAKLNLYKNNTYIFSLYGAIISEGNFKRKGDVIYLVDDNTKAIYKISVIDDNKLFAISLPLFIHWVRKGELNNEKKSERKNNKQENGFMKKQKD